MQDHAIMQDRASRDRASSALMAANFFVSTDRMETYLAVYLVYFKGWEYVYVGIVSLVMNTTMVGR